MTWPEFQDEFEQTWIDRYLRPTIYERLDPLIPHVEYVPPRGLETINEPSRERYRALSDRYWDFGHTVMMFFPQWNWVISTKGLRRVVPELPLGDPYKPTGRAGGDAPFMPAAVLNATGYQELLDAMLEFGEEIEFDEAAHITKDTLASLLRRKSLRRAMDDMSEGLDRRTVNYIHTILHRAFKDAVRWGRLARNPADSADPPRGGQKSDSVHAWDAATLRTFLIRSRDSGDRLHVLWLLLATTGMRRGEAIGLRWSDVDLEARRVRIVQTITQTRSKVSIGEPKTSRGRRSIAVDNATAAALKEHGWAMREERMLVGPDFSGEGLVFHQPDGSWLRPDAVSAQFVRRAERYGLPRLSLHGLRHTWATLALEQGIHPRVVQERLGHSTIAITLGIYSHVSPTLHDEAASTVASLVT